LVHPNILNQEESKISTKNTTFPKPRKTPKSSPFTHRFGRGITRKGTTKGSCIHPAPNLKEKGLKTATRKSPRKDYENHQKGKTGETQSSLEEPCRIIYTYYEGSYKVYLASRSSIPLSRSHHEAVKLVLENPKENRKGKWQRKMS
jgi:hypothetical protein